MPTYGPIETKPRRTGAWILSSVGVWFYTARPELYRRSPSDKLKFPFFQTPAHLRGNCTIDGQEC